MYRITVRNGSIFFKQGIQSKDITRFEVPGRAVQEMEIIYYRGLKHWIPKPHVFRSSFPRSVVRVLVDQDKLEKDKKIGGWKNRNGWLYFDIKDPEGFVGFVKRSNEDRKYDKKETDFKKGREFSSDYNTFKAILEPKKQIKKLSLFMIAPLIISFFLITIIVLGYIMESDLVEMISDPSLIMIGTFFLFFMMGFIPLITGLVIMVYKIKIKKEHIDGIDGYLVIVGDKYIHFQTIIGRYEFPLNQIKDVKETSSSRCGWTGPIRRSKLNWGPPHAKKHVRFRFKKPTKFLRYRRKELIIPIDDPDRFISLVNKRKDS